ERVRRERRGERARRLAQGEAEEHEREHDREESRPVDPRIEHRRRLSARRVAAATARGRRPSGPVEPRELASTTAFSGLPFSDGMAERSTRILLVDDEQSI